MLSAWVVPSGGDWALRRAGAVHLEGTARVNVSACSFVRTDANAIMVSGFNRNTTISDSTFTWLGMSAVALMGDCAQEDCTGGLQPWGTAISGCVFSELGIIEKQSSAVFLAKAAFTRVEDCLMFNGPRAMVNFNDGMGGGHNITDSAMWNTWCVLTGSAPSRPPSFTMATSHPHSFTALTAAANAPCSRLSGDHGPANSWNRMPFATRLASPDASASFAALPSEVSHLYVDAGYGGSQAFDNDDGACSAPFSPLLVPPLRALQLTLAPTPRHFFFFLFAAGSAFYTIHSNVFWHSDFFKMDYGGHDSESYDNLIVVRTYDGQACINSGDYVPGHETRLSNNTCVLPPRGSNGRDPDVVSHVDQACFGPAPGRLVAYGNHYHTLNDNATVQCGDGTSRRVVDMPAPFEEGSTSAPLPDTDTLLGWARAKLGL